MLTHFSTNTTLQTSKLLLNQQTVLQLHVHKRTGQRGIEQVVTLLSQLLQIENAGSRQQEHRLVLLVLSLTTRLPQRFCFVIRWERAICDLFHYFLHRFRLHITGIDWRQAVLLADIEREIAFVVLQVIRRSTQEGGDGHHMRRSSPALDQIIVSNPKTLHQKLSITPIIQPNISYGAINPFSIISQVIQRVDCFVVQIHLLESK